MQHPAGDDQNTDPTPEPDPDPGPSEVDDEENLSAMEADLDSVDAVLEAIDRGDLDAAESIAAGLGPTDDASTDPDPDIDLAQVTAPSDPE